MYEKPLRSIIPFPTEWFVSQPFILGRIMQIPLVAHQILRTIGPGILVAVTFFTRKGEITMQTAETKFRATPSSQDRKFNWEFLACWLTYFVVGVTVSYSLFSYWVL